MREGGTGAEKDECLTSPLLSEYSLLLYLNSLLMLITKSLILLSPHSTPPTYPAVFVSFAGPSALKYKAFSEDLP